jgi:D-alanine-D-alanine ligase
MDLTKGKYNIAVVVGGFSSEKDISIKSGTQVAGWLDKSKFNVYLVYIHRDEWYCDHNNKKFPINKDNFSITYNGQTIQFDFAVIMIHGHPGENGILQAYFDLVGIPYSTSSARVSHLTFDKNLSKLYLQQFGIKTANSLLITRSTYNEKTTSDILTKLGLPVVIKPNASGSSFGVSLVKNEKELNQAIEKAFSEDPSKVLAESYIKGTEVSCGVFSDGENIITMPPTEIVPETEFFDYEAKYLGKSKEITPARLPEKTITRIQEQSKLIYELFMCYGIVRVDFIVSDNEMYYLEINTVPGMSAESIFPQQARVKGLSMTDIFNDIILNKLEK